MRICPPVHLLSATFRADGRVEHGTGVDTFWWSFDSLSRERDENERANTSGVVRETRSFRGCGVNIASPPFKRSYGEQRTRLATLSTTTCQRTPRQGFALMVVDDFASRTHNLAQRAVRCGVAPSSIRCCADLPESITYTAWDPPVTQ